MKLDKLVASTLTILLFLSLSSAALAVQPPEICNSPSSQQLSSLPPVDKARVVAIASTSNRFSDAILGASLRLSGISYDAYLNRSTCAFQAEAVDASFYVSYPNGTKLTVLVTETFPPSTVTNVQEMPALNATVGQSSNDVWSGYQLDALPGGSNVAILATYGDFVQPSVDKPGNHGPNQPGCNWWVAYCALATWVGVSTATQSGALLQDGTLGTARSDGSISYQMWWEDTTAGGITYCSQSMAAGDEMRPQVRNSAVTGGDPNYWYVYVYDVTNGQTCVPASGNPYRWSYVTYWSNFILERPKNGAGGHTDLPYFTTFNLKGSVYYQGSWHAITEPWSNGWGWWYTMINPTNPNGKWNICSGVVASPCNQSVTPANGYYGQFTNTWLTSENT